MGNHGAYRAICSAVDDVMYKSSPFDDLFFESMFAPFTMLPYLKKGLLKLPLWVIGVASPGTGKTKRLSLFDLVPDNLKVSTLTPNALISGWRDESDTDPSLLLQLDHKIMTIKDMTAIYQQNKEARDAIMGQLRDVYDGTASKATGVTGLVQYQATFNLLGVITHIYDHFYSVSTILGERFLPIRLYAPYDSRPAEMVVESIIGGAEDTDDSIKIAIRKFFKHMETPDLSELPVLKHKKHIVALTEFVCRIRSHVMRDPGTKEIIGIPQCESNTRLSGLFTMMLANKFILNWGEDVEDSEVISYLAWLSRCCIPTINLHVLHHLYRLYIINQDSNFNTTPIRELEAITGLARGRLGLILDDMRFNKLVDIRNTATGGGNRRPEYKLKSEVFEMLQMFQFFGGHDYRLIQPELIKNIDIQEN